MVKKALITGITGQDGSYLAEFLLEKGYEVHGLVRRTSVIERKNLKKIYHSFQDRNLNLFLHYGDMTDSSSIIRILSKVRPDEIYNLAAQSHVKISFEIPEYTAESDALGVLRLLESARKLGLENTKIYQASTSELFGLAKETPQNEQTPLHPRSPYGVAKLYAYWTARTYREAYNMFVCNGILFNHESPRRGENFVTRKITKGIAEIKKGVVDKILIGNMEAKRDWGYAKEYIEAMWLMLQKDKPEDYVIATGEAHSVREFIEESFKTVGINIIWQGKGINEKGIDSKTGKVLVEVDPQYFRPLEVDFLVGDTSKAKKELGWEAKTKFKDLIKIMVQADLENVNLMTREEDISKQLREIEETLKKIRDERPKDIHIHEPTIIEKKALITGITGQDGSYLAEFLLEKGYEVWGIVNPEESSLEKIAHIKDKLHLKEADIKDYNSVKTILQESKPLEIYNLAALSNIGQSFKQPEETLRVNFEGVKNLMVAMDELKLNSRFFQASTVRIIEKNNTNKLSENSFFSAPKSPYEESKLAAQQLLNEYKQKKGMFICSAFLSNHESPRRGENFVTRKITQGLVRIKLGLQETLELGNINSKADWGYAKEYIEAMWLMLQKDKPEDYVIATGEAHSVREFIEEAAKQAGLNIFSNRMEGLDEKYTDENGNTLIKINPEFLRPIDSDTPEVDPSKAKKELGWEAKTKFKDLIKIMVQAEFEQLKEEKTPNKITLN